MRQADMLSGGRTEPNSKGMVQRNVLCGRKSCCSVNMNEGEGVVAQLLLQAMLKEELPVLAGAATRGQVPGVGQAGKKKSVLNGTARKRTQHSKACRYVCLEERGVGRAYELCSR